MVNKPFMKKRLLTLLFLAAVSAAPLIRTAGPLFAGDNTLTVAGTDSAAIAAAIARSAPGDTVRLPAGTYTLTEAIRPKPRTRLLGAGTDRTVLRFTGDKPSTLINLEGCEDVEVAGMTLDGANNANAQQGVFAHDSRRLRLHHLLIRNLVKGKGFGPQGIDIPRVKTTQQKSVTHSENPESTLDNAKALQVVYAHDSGRLRLHHLIIRNFVMVKGFGPHGIYFTGVNPTKQKAVTDSEIADCTLENIGVGATYGGGIRIAWGSARNRVLRNTIRNTGRGGIFGDSGATDLVVQKNTVGGSQGEGLGIEMWGGCDRAIVEDNRVDHWISIDSSSYSAVRRNRISDRSGEYKLAGLELVASRYCVFTDNIIDGGQRIGISVSNRPAKDYIYWGYNRVSNCNQWGAQIQGESGGAGYHYFYRCTFRQTPVARGKVAYPGDEGHGFRTNGGVHHLTLEECEVRDNERLGLQLGGQDVDFLSFVRCTISGNRGPAVSGPRHYTALEWVDCRVTNNGSNTLPAAKPFPRAAPVASFDAPAKAYAGEPVRLRSVARAAGNGKIARALWDFSEGIPSTEESVTHTYKVPGSYRVTLVVWDDAGRGARVEKRILISRKHPAGR